MKQLRSSFGPVVHHIDGSDEFRASCVWCTFRINITCTHVRPPRLIPDTENTPEWCEMREAMLRDAREAVQKEENAP